MNINKCKSYKLIEEKSVSDINSQVYICEHIKTGAKVFLIENDYNNKVFNIGFRTPPFDSTGLQHIMEHSVLCGSKKYPAKDPFVELAKGSLNTFLNAMTYSDKTVYPVASCNDKDFMNLIKVYLDGVFYPNIYEREEIFMQEGWHYELEDDAEDININGVVYNEMKGVYSSPDDIFYRKIMDSLFPDTCYRYESGGTPEEIPNLTYDNFIDFHKNYYHPSNSYIYLYGDCDMEGILNYIDEEYLCVFDKKNIDSIIALQAPFGEMREFSFEYSITEDETLADNTYLSYNAVIDTSLDRELYVAFQIIEYALVGASGAVLKEALLSNGIGKDIMSMYENGIYQPYFSIMAKNANVNDKDKFLEIINNVLNEIVKNGFDKKTLLAGINSFEFKYREADFGNYPKGLMYGLQAFDSWLYDGDPIMHIAQNDTFALLKEKVDEGYFEALVAKYLIGSNHATMVALTPAVNLNAVSDLKLREKLADFKTSLSEDEIDKLIKSTKHLKEYQEEEDSEDVLNLLPLLSIDDLDKKAEGFINKVYSDDNIKVVSHNIFTNGIAYIRILFDLSKIKTEDLQYVSLLKELLGLLDTKDFAYADLASEINLNSGGVNPGGGLFINMISSNEYTHTFEMKASVLYDKIKFAFDMFNQILFTTDFSDDKRLKELLNMLKSRLQATLMSSGHTYASLRAASNVSEIGAINEYMSGISYYRFIEDIADNYDEKAHILRGKLISCMNTILTKENFILADITAEDSVTDEFISLTNDFAQKLGDVHEEKQERKLNFTGKNEGFKTSGKVQYVAKAGNYIDENHPYKGTLKILRVIMGYDYLWNNVRVMGGAYGCFSTFTRFGDSFFVSYRDPNLKNTLDIFDKASEYFKEFVADERTMTKYIIGTIADLDTPLSPSSKGSRSLSAYMNNMSEELLQKERDEILGANQEDVRELASYLSNIINNSYICVVGGEEAVNSEKSLFDNIEPLLR